jgi:hypothetical protein
MPKFFGNRTVVISGGGSAASARRNGRTPEAPASAIVLRKRRRVCIIIIETSLQYHAFSSRLSSFKKRQSVPSAMIFCGLALTKPTSCIRTA